jgi:hypothetical protein
LSKLAKVLIHVLQTLQKCVVGQLALVVHWQWAFALVLLVPNGGWGLPCKKLCKAAVFQF